MEEDSTRTESSAPDQQPAGTEGAPERPGWFRRLLVRTGVWQDVWRVAAIAALSLLLALALNAMHPRGLSLTLAVAKQPGVTVETWNQLQFIGATEAAQILQEEPQAALVDARHGAENMELRARSAYSLPYNEFANRFDTFARMFPADRTVVVYGQGPPVDFAVRVAARLRQRGYDDVLIIRGGLADWVEAGLPTKSCGQKEGESADAPG